MKLIPDWKLAWKFMSVQAGLLLTALSMIQADVLPLVSPLFAAEKWPWVSGSLAIAIVVLRLIAQESLSPERAQLELDRLEASAAAAPLAQEMPEPAPGSYNPMPAGRFERYIGAVAGIVIGLVIIGLISVAVWFAR